MHKYKFVGLGVLTPATFWIVTTCRAVEFHRCFGVTYGLHLQGKILNHASSQQEGDKQTLDPEDEALCSSETSVFYRTVRRHIP
jgi:hypothetical protein